MGMMLDLPFSCDVYNVAVCVFASTMLKFQKKYPLPYVGKTHKTKTNYNKYSKFKTLDEKYEKKKQKKLYSVNRKDKQTSIVMIHAVFSSIADCLVGDTMWHEHPYCIHW